MGLRVLAAGGNCITFYALALETRCDPFAACFWLKTSPKPAQIKKKGIRSYLLMEECNVLERPLGWEVFLWPSLETQSAIEQSARRKMYKFPILCVSFYQQAQG